MNASEEKRAEGSKKPKPNSSRWKDCSRRAKNKTVYSEKPWLRQPRVMTPSVGSTTPKKTGRGQMKSHAAMIRGSPVGKRVYKEDPDRNVATGLYESDDMGRTQEQRHETSIGEVFSKRDTQRPRDRRMNVSTVLCGNSSELKSQVVVLGPKKSRWVY